MNRVFQGLLVLCWVVFGALAAKAQSPTQVTAEVWNGGYGGGHTGYRWGDLEVSGGQFGNETFSLNAALIGAHVGYNVVLSNTMLIGIEADIDVVQDKSRSNAFAQTTVIAGVESEPIAVTRTQTSTASMNWQATLRARLGIIDGGTLYYTTAGIAWLDTEWTQTASIGPVQTTVSKDQVIPGWAAGGGVATLVAENLIARGEYLYEEFFDRSVPLAAGGSGKLSARAHKLRFGVSIRF